MARHRVGLFFLLTRKFLFITPRPSALPQDQPYPNRSSTVAAQPTSGQLQTTADSPLEYPPGDGLVGCFISHGFFFVTSPNCSKIYQPPLGNDRTVHMRVNLRYGPDDPLQWPQPYVPMYAHHIAIRLPVRDQQNPLSLAWWLPEKQHFVQDPDSLFTGVGRLENNMLRSFQQLCEDLLHRIAKSEQKSALVTDLSTLLSDFLHRLESLPTDFDTLLLLVRGWQRIYLELLALMDFLEVYLPRMRGQVQYLGHTTAPVMGCFTHKYSHAEMIQRAGIRFWLVRPSEQIASARIRTVVSLRCPDNLIPLEPHKRARWTYRGSNSDSEKNTAIIRELRNILSYPDIFATTISPDEANIPPPEPPQPKKVSFRPYPKQRNRNANQSSGQSSSPVSASPGRDKFAEPNCGFFPLPIKSWQTALSAVVRPSHSNLKDVWGYMLPEPAGLVAIQNADRQRAMFQFWLKFRAAFIYQATSTRTGATPNSATFWRKLLGQDFEKSSPQSAASGTKTSKLRDCVQEYIKKCVDNVNLLSTNSSQLALRTMDNVNAVWLGKPFADLDHADLEQVLWELTELNFRFELVALDKWAVVPPKESEAKPADRQSLVEACFWNVRRGSLFTVPLSSANKGLADHDWRKRSKYLLALKDLMKSWRGDKPASLLTPDKLRWGEVGVLELEEDLAKFYTQSFFNYARRAPILPRHLVHIISEPVVEPPASTGGIVHLNPAPGIYYDLKTLKLDAGV
ncbi:hypothetical protein BDN72DRAFT_863504 [Pluteus cervinus]|uniref:Uncharacterized protein n=1 Tax=Pluteus cervinus TaxID=181527 RepID=A0ACD3A850_9AGAR|nr:hypothetical protein BDN72DRAFT_863504 [Pluteus cervinus]